MALDPQFDELWVQASEGRNRDSSIDERAMMFTSELQNLAALHRYKVRFEDRLAAIVHVNNLEQQWRLLHSGGKELQKGATVFQVRLDVMHLQRLCVMGDVSKQQLGELSTALLETGWSRTGWSDAAPYLRCPVDALDNGETLQDLLDEQRRTLARVGMFTTLQCGTF